MDRDWLRKPAAQIGRAIAAGTVNAVELAEAYLDAAASHPSGARIYARLTAGRARNEAMAAAARAKDGRRHGPIDGVPVSWKDLFDTAGTGTEAGSALLHGRVPARDADVLAEATRAGLVCLGKTHMSELAFSGLGLNPVTATPPNVHEPAAVPGGSSSGAAASVAFGLAAGAIGSDTGGSVRVPAAWNDLCGFKPAHGALPLTGVVPLAERFDTVGPLARTVEDCALLCAAMGAGPAPDLRGASVAGARLVILETVALDDLRAGPARSFDSACARLARAGATLSPLRMPIVEEAMALAGALYTAEAYGLWRDVIEAAPDRMFPRILDRFRAGAGVSAADYVAGWRRLEVLRRQWGQAVAGFDAVILPTAPNNPPDAARLLTDDAYYVTENLLTLRNTRIGNLFDLCALTVPTDEPACGLMLMAERGAEGRLLRLGHAVQPLLCDPGA
jgi:aspartyl-tRNA(Asn)/glutamyl-tRNA(Gln) amidotransferase subunit A